MKILKTIMAVALISLMSVCADAQKRKSATDKRPVSDPKNHVFVGYAYATDSPLTMYNDAVARAFMAFVSWVETKDRVPELTLDVSLDEEHARKKNGTCSVRYLKSQLSDDYMFYVWLEISPEGKLIYEAEESFEISATSSYIDGDEYKTRSEVCLKYDIHIYDESSGLTWQSSLEETSTSLNVDGFEQGTIASKIRSNTESFTVNTSASSK